MKKFLVIFFLETQLHILQPANAKGIKQRAGVLTFDYIMGAFRPYDRFRHFLRIAAGADQVMNTGPGAGHIVTQHPRAVVVGADISRHIGQHHGRRVAGFIAGPFEALDMYGKGFGAVSNIFRCHLDALGEQIANPFAAGDLIEQKFHGAQIRKLNLVTHL